MDLGSVNSGIQSASSDLAASTVAPPSPQFGVSRPISTDPPTTEELKLTDQLVECLNSFDLFENDEELQKRLDVLRRINALVRSWVPSENLDTVGGKLFTFGSYRLGVHTKGADIDSLCVVPRHVDRTEFFKSFYEMLSQDENVTDLHPVDSAFVPLIKLKYCDIEIDILFARLALKEVPETQELADDNLLRNLDEKSIRSLNGCRVADEILRLIPNRQNFIVTLRAVKIWAKRHGIYSNSLGFFGGITWAILVARTCQLYPLATPAILLSKFFLLFAFWFAKQLLLHDNESSNRTDIPSLRDMVWDPRNRVGDRYHLMPVITPAYPEQNSTFNVTNSTKSVITTELADAFQITLDIIAGKETWSALFEEVNFFSRYRHFLTLLCITETEKDHLVFSSLVESKIRILIGSLERNEAVNMCHINSKQFKPRPEAMNTAPNAICTLWFLGLDLKKETKKNIDLTIEIQSFTDTVLSACCMSGVYKESMLVRLNYLPRKELTKWLTEGEIAKNGRPHRKRPPIGSSSSLISDAIKRPSVELKTEPKKMRLNESACSV
ncbi:Poly(A) polymerase and Nucleotidyltransferase domain containing protein [Aphelenchoides besseyi]|nr:Poly(A) polymerase and Nucleotidyltransferase domain containing protein [Aphelenchoides besseyi]KAI6200009.1 Poly(A) polymerase and Nucleotidyltransferase domain containing protein [Aphelenchoides besseyi]